MLNKILGIKEVEMMIQGGRERERDVAEARGAKTDNYIETGRKAVQLRV